MKLNQLVLFAVMAAAAQGLAQQNSGTMRPKPKSEAVDAPLLVMCDLACNWKLDGKVQGIIAADDSVTVRLSLGKHLVAAATLDGLDRI
jgi:hypothetical protein